MKVVSLFFGVDIIIVPTTPLPKGGGREKYFSLSSPGLCMRKITLKTPGNHTFSVNSCIMVLYMFTSDLKRCELYLEDLVYCGFYWKIYGKSYHAQIPGLPSPRGWPVLQSKYQSRVQSHIQLRVQVLLYKP